MNGIFINGNRPPRPKHRGLILGLIACLALGQLLLYVLFLGPAFFPPRPEETRAEVPTIVNSRPLPTSPPARTLRSAAEGPILDAFFGPLPVLEGEPRKISHDKPLRGIYLGMGENLEAALELASWSELNAVVVDVKESWGLCYESAVPLAVELKASSGQLELKSLIDRCHAAGLTFIARMVCFKDEVMTRMQPDLCIRDAEGKVLHYPLEGGEAFANPYNTEVWDYLLDLSREVIAMGADEIQFDYVRFPTGQPEGGATPLYREESDVRTKPEESDPQDQREPLEIPEKEAAINRFLETARIELQDKLGVPVSADLFSIVMSSPEDGRLIGQNWSRIGLSGIHCLSPPTMPTPRQLRWAMVKVLLSAANFLMPLIFLLMTWSRRPWRMELLRRVKAVMPACVPGCRPLRQTGLRRATIWTMGPAKSALRFRPSMMPAMRNGCSGTPVTSTRRPFS